MKKKQPKKSPKKKPTTPPVSSGDDELERRRLAAFRTALYLGFGATEGCSCVTCDRFRDWQRRARAAAKTEQIPGDLPDRPTDDFKG